MTDRKKGTIHIRTGAELLSVENDDENKSFGIGFKTPPPDNTGTDKSHLPWLRPRSHSSTQRLVSLLPPPDNKRYSSNHEGGYKRRRYQDDEPQRESSKNQENQ